MCLVLAAREDRTEASAARPRFRLGHDMAAPTAHAVDPVTLPQLELDDIPQMA